MKRSVTCSLVILPAAILLCGFQLNKVVALPLQEASPELTGSLTNPWWREGKIYTSFVTVSPSPGRKGSERTAAYILRDSQNLYVGLRLDDRQVDSIRAEAQKPGKIDADDWAGVSIQPSASSPSAICFMTNPKGIQAMATVDSNGVRHPAGTKPWSVKARRNPSGWSAELQIPFSSIPIDGKIENTIGVQFIRHISRTNEIIHGPAFGQATIQQPTEYQKCLLAKDQ